MGRSQGDHLNPRETKMAIIGFILKNDKAVPEPEIRDFLTKNYGMTDQGNIREHLKNLKDSNCVEKILPKKSGLANKWEIKKIENLQEIRVKYPNIQLNKYDKALNIILEEQVRKGGLLHVDATNAQGLRVQLFLSVSFFDMCLKNDIETLYDKACEIYKLGEGFSEDKHIENCISEFYTKYIIPISIKPSIWLTVYNEYINSQLNTDFYQSPLKCSQNVEIGISEEAFRIILEKMNVWRTISHDEWKRGFEEEFTTKIVYEILPKMWEGISIKCQKTQDETLNKLPKYILKKILEEIPILGEETSNKEWNLRCMEELSVKLSYEIFQEMLKEISVEFLKTPEEVLKVWVGTLKKILEEVLKKLVEIPKEMYDKILKITYHWYIRRLTSHEIIFEHFFQRDIVDGNTSSDERDFVVMMKSLQADFVEKRMDAFERSNATDKFYRDYYKKCREKWDFMSP